jgi:hypothetical protein
MQQKPSTFGEGMGKASQAGSPTPLLTMHAAYCKMRRLMALLPPLRMRSALGALDQQSLQRADG